MKKTGRREEKRTFAINSGKEAEVHKQKHFLVIVTQHFVGFAGLAGRGATGLSEKS